MNRSSQVGMHRKQEAGGIEYTEQHRMLCRCKQGLNSMECLQTEDNN